MQERLNEAGEPQKIEVKIGEGLIEITPETEKSTTPVLVAPGWSNTLETMQDSLKELAEAGYNVLSLEHSRLPLSHENLDLDMQDLELREGQNKAPTVELQKALQLLEVLRFKQTDQVDAVGYSEAGINLLIAAIIEPDKFRNIVLVNPAGLVANDSLMAQNKRLSADKRKTAELYQSEDEKKRRLRAGWEQLKYLLSNPVLATQEGLAIAKANIMPLIEEVRNQGIKVAIISSVDDQLFPMDRVQDRASSVDTKDGQLLINGFYSINGSHHNLVVKPEEVIPVIDHALEQLAREKTDD